MIDSLERLKRQVDAAMIGQITMKVMTPEESEAYKLAPGFHMRIGDFLIRDTAKTQDYLHDEDGP